MTTSDDETDGVDRRQFLAATGGLASVATVTALAGCAEEEGDDEGEEEPDPQFRRPVLPGNPAALDQPMQFLVESAEYRNRLVEEIHEEVVDD